MKFHVRRAIIGDEPVLRALRLQALSDSPQSFSTTYERELARTTEDWRRWITPGVTFLLEAAGEPRGLVAGVRDKQDPAMVHLMAMWVHPDLRGTGAAGQLISSVKGWAAEVGATRVRLGIVEGNERARRCYERAGFRLTGGRDLTGHRDIVEIEMLWDGLNRGD